MDEKARSCCDPAPDSDQEAHPLATQSPATPIVLTRDCCWPVKSLLLTLSVGNSSGGSSDLTSMRAHSHHFCWAGDIDLRSRGPVWRTSDWQSLVAGEARDLQPVCSILLWSTAGPQHLLAVFWVGLPWLPWNSSVMSKIKQDNILLCYFEPCKILPSAVWVRLPWTAFLMRRGRQDLLVTIQRALGKANPTSIK